MRRCGKRLSAAARELREEIRHGITTYDLDMLAGDKFKKFGIRPAFLNYGHPPFKGRICVSINNEIVHGLPSKKKIIENGDILSLDIGASMDGFYTDMAFTVGVGRISRKAKDIIKVTRRALEAGTECMRVGKRLFDISHAIQKVAEESGYSVVRDLVGHGIGRKLHEQPQVPNYGKKGTGPLLKAGMVFAIEPMLNMGSGGIMTSEDEWTVLTLDGSISCHFENTVAVTSAGPERLTGIELEV